MKRLIEFQETCSLKALVRNKARALFLRRILGGGEKVVLIN